MVFFMSSSADLFAQNNENVKQEIEEILTKYCGVDDPPKSVWLAELGNKAVPILLEKLQEGGFSATIIEALGMIGNERAVPVLLGMLEEDIVKQSGAAQFFIIEALAKIGDSAAEITIFNYLQELQTQGSHHQLEIADALLKVGSETSRQKVKETTSYVQDLYQRSMWTFDEEAQELNNSAFKNEEIVNALLAGLIIDLRDEELLTKAIKYRQLIDETGPRYTEGFKVLTEIGNAQTIETVYKFAENNQELWPPAPPNITEEERMRFFTVHPLVRVAAVETLLTVSGIDVERVRKAFEDISVEDFREIPLTVKIQPDKWSFQWEKTKGKDDEDNNDGEGEGKISCYLGNIPGGYKVGDILPETILLNGKVEVSKHDKKRKIHARIKEHHKGFIGEVLEVKFNKFDAIKSIESVWPGKECNITITGKLSDDRPFRGSCWIKISRSEEGND